MTTATVDPRSSARILRLMARVKRLDVRLEEAGEDPKKQLGARLRFAREVLGFTRPDINERLGLSTVTLGNWEDGKNTANVMDLAALADLYGISMDWLLGRRPPAGKAIIDKEMYERIISLPVAAPESREAEQAANAIREVIDIPAPFKIAIVIPEGAEWMDEDEALACAGRAVEHAKRVAPKVIDEWGVERYATSTDEEKGDEGVGQ